MAGGAELKRSVAHPVVGSIEASKTVGATATGMQASVNVS